jgi:tRNA U38,U39,U40 pseudouridine synthase TruA
MDEMIGYCGYNCHLCAARSDDPAVRQRLVDGWRKLFGHEDYIMAGAGRLPPWTAN